MSAAKKLPLSGGNALGQRPFSALDVLRESLPLAAMGSRPAPENDLSPAVPPTRRELPVKHRGRVDILRSTAGRGGKTVTLVEGFVGIGLPEKELLAKRMQKSCGCGGTVKDGRIEIQGDKRDEVARILAEAGFRPVFAGG